MKKVLVDANIIDKQKLLSLKNNNIRNKFKKDIKLFASEILLKQRLAHLYCSGHRADYNFYINFLKTYFEHKMVDFSGNIAIREINSAFQKTEIFANFYVENLKNIEEVDKTGENYDIEFDRMRKIYAGDNFKKFANNLKIEISELYSAKDWESFCYEFVNRYDFALGPMYEFLSDQQKFNKNTFFKMLNLWWEYSIVASTLRYFKTPNADKKTIDIIKYGKISKKSFLYHQFKAEKYILTHCFLKGKRFDYDSPNDVMYIAFMKDFDILLTDDETFMKDCFSEIIKNKNKRIMKIGEFIKNFS